MYRRKLKAVKPKEADWPVNLEKLGLFINQNDELRQIANPEKRFDYFFHGKYQEGHAKERLNERRREAVDECLRITVIDRLRNLGLNVVRVPLGVAEDQPHMKVLISEGIENAKKVLLLSPDSSGSDLGIWGIRLMEEESLNKGSMVDTVKRAQKDGYHLVICNPAHIIWDPDTRRAMNFTSWKAKDKKSPHIHDIKNRIHGIETPEAHLSYMWDTILKEKVPEEASIDVMAVGYSAYCIMMHVQKSWDYWQKRVFAMALGESSHHTSNITSNEFRNFLARRIRNYIIHAEERGTSLFDRRFGCATFSSGEIWVNHIFPTCYNLMLDYLKNAHENPDNCNPDVPIIITDDDPQSDSMDWRRALRTMDPENPEHGWTIPVSNEVGGEQVNGNVVEIAAEKEENWQVELMEKEEENKRAEEMMDMS